MSRCKKSILIFADSGDGKTTQTGCLAEKLFVEKGLRTRVYSADGGGWDPVKPYVEAGVMEIVDLTAVPRPWEWVNKIVQGMVPVGGGKWEVKLDGIGMVVYEGLTGIGDVLMQDLPEQASNGVNIGGSANVNFTQGDTKVGGNNVAHFGVVQSRIASAVGQSQRLDMDYVVWTALARRGQDQDNLSTILGPQAVGKALTSEIPRWFSYTFRLMVVPGNPLLKTKTEYRLYVRDHMDPTAAGAKGMGNDRTPLDATPLPEYIVPADIVKALELIGKAQVEATVKVRGRIDAARAAKGVK
jgi:hypothetical protein